MATHIKTDGTKRSVANLLRAIADVIEENGKIEEIITESEVKVAPIVLRETTETHAPEKKPLKLEKFTEFCTKCEKLKRGEKQRGRHSTGCSMGAGKVTVRQERPPVTGEAPSTGYVADWRSKCCGARLLVKGGEEGTNHYECSKCFYPTDPVLPNTLKKFDCESCGKQFEADVEGSIACTHCGSNEYWPSNL